MLSLQKMDYNDYVENRIKLSEDYAKLNYRSGFRYHLALQGTNITVRRSTKGEFREALGPAYIFDGTDTENSEETFSKRIIINRSQLVNNYKTTTNDLEAYINEDFFKIGDQVEFVDRDVFYKYKVIDIDQFDPYSNMLFKITLAGFEEIKVK